MGTNYLAILGVTTMTTVMSCSSAKKEYASYELYPVRSGNLVEMEYAPGATRFTLWAPTADEVKLYQKSCLRFATAGTLPGNRGYVYLVRTSRQCLSLL